MVHGNINNIINFNSIINNNINSNYNNININNNRSGLGRVVERRGKGTKTIRAFCVLQRTVTLLSAQ
jgi:hypothetical protein